MPEVKKEDAKKELDSILNKHKTNAQKDAESKLSQEEQDALEKERKEKEEAKQKEEAKRAEQKKKDDEILAKPEDQLTKEEKDRKKILLEEKQKLEDSKLSTQEKIQKIKEESQKRIDEIVNELKQLKDKGSKEAQDLQRQLQVLQTENENLTKQLSQGPDKGPSALEQREKDRISKYIEEDKDKSREERREMSKEELDAWFIDDPVAANQWMIKNTIRRENDRRQDRVYENLKDLLDKQEKSANRVHAKHPELNTEKREAELKNQGKQPAEIRKILCDENEKYRICQEILGQDPEKYLTAPDGPELIAKEMEKRLTKDASAQKTEDQKRIEELQKQADEQAAKIAELEALIAGDEGINSITQRQRRSQEQLTEQEQTLVNTMKFSNATQQMIDSALKKLRAKKGKT